MGNRIFRVTFGYDPLREKETQGETWEVDENGYLRIFNTEQECTIMFSSTSWLYVEDITTSMKKIEEVKSFLGRT